MQKAEAWWRMVAQGSTWWHMAAHGGAWCAGLSQGTCIFTSLVSPFPPHLSPRTPSPFTCALTKPVTHAAYAHVCSVCDV